MIEFLKLGWRIFASNFWSLSQPYKITFAITYNCNSRCKTCNIWKKKSTNELTTREIKKIFKNINPSWVNLTGGEPFLRRDIFDIAKIIRDNTDTYLLNMTTNGLLGDLAFKDIKKITNLGFPKFIVVVSLDGPEKIHDYIRGIKGNWKKSIELYKKLRKLSKEKRNFETYLGYTASTYNIGQFSKTLEEAKKEIPTLKIRDFHLNFYHESEVYFDNKKLSRLNKNFLIDLKKTIDAFKSKKIGFNPISFLEFKYLSLIDNYLKTKTSPLPCKALQSSCYIDPHGNVYPCTIFNTIIGNLRDSNYDLKKNWNSEKAKKIRKLIKQNKCPGCWTPCEAYQTILGNLLKK
ncbi:MAG: radical SAM protein [Candidatus Aenigmarchaeota archaeon]|nr:radical SAM protein [Candidatus Aenigmarchaeota archaeon]